MTVNDAMKETVNKLIAVYGMGCEVSSSDLKETISRKYGIPKESILPPDYCYNRINRGISVSGPTYLEYVEMNKYRCWGEGYSFNGKIYHKPKTKTEIEVGKCINGVRRLYNDSDVYGDDSAYLLEKDIKDNIILFKVNNSYSKTMSKLQLYDITRGCWKRKIQSVEAGEYALSVVDGVVVEVYSINGWNNAEDDKRETIPFDAQKEKGRIIFHGEIAPDRIRKRYILKDVSKLYKRGEADPIKTIFNRKPVEALDETHSFEEREKHANEISISDLENIAKIHGNKSPGKTVVNVTQVKRDPYIAEYAKRKANGVCQLCRQNAPFINKKGEPYLESHHIIWLSEGGEDSIENTVALCPNCHRRMHVLNDIKDIDTLRRRE